MQERKLTRTVWMTAEGKRVRVRDLDNGHLLNIIRMLRRYSKKVLEESSHDFDPDALLSATIPTWAALLKEASQRGLGQFL